MLSRRSLLKTFVAAGAATKLPPFIIAPVSSAAPLIYGKSPVRTAKECLELNDVFIKTFSDEVFKMMNDAMLSGQGGIELKKGDTVTIARHLPIEETTDFIANGDFKLADTS